MEKVFKIVLLGTAKSGKTSLRNKLIYGTFSPHYTPTINADFISTYISLDGTGSIAAVQIWDIDGGQASNLAIANSLCHDADGLVLVFDGEREGKEVLDDMVRFLLIVSKINRSKIKDLPIPVVFARNKSDKSINVSIDDITMISRKCGLDDNDFACIDTSALSGYNVIELFKQISTMCKHRWVGSASYQGLTDQNSKPRLSRHGDPIVASSSRRAGKSEIEEFGIDDSDVYSRPTRPSNSFTCSLRRLLCLG